MTKLEFEARLREQLTGRLPEEDIQKSLEFYDEMLADRLEAGMSEEEAVADLGPMEDIVSGSLSAVPMGTLIKEKVRPKRALRPWELLLLVLGSPVWLAVLLAVLSVIVAVYVTLWALVAAAWAVTAAFTVGVPAGLLAGLWLVSVGPNQPLGVFLIGAGIACAGLGILGIGLSRKLTEWVLRLGKSMWLGLKKLIAGKEQA